MQKIFYLFLVFIAAGLASNAQITKGSILLGGNIGFSTQTYNANSPNEQKTTFLSAVPNYGWAVKDNTVLGFDLDYGYQSYNYPGSDKSTSNTYGAGIFLRNYKNLGGRFYLFGQGGLDGSYTTTKDINLSATPTTEIDTKGYSLAIDFYPGIAYLVGNRLMLETGFPDIFYARYNHSQQQMPVPGNPGTETSSNGFSIGSSLNNSYTLSVGLRLLLASR